MNKSIITKYAALTITLMVHATIYTMDANNNSPSAETTQSLSFMKALVKGHCVLENVCSTNNNTISDSWVFKWGKTKKSTAQSKSTQPTKYLHTVPYKQTNEMIKNATTVAILIKSNQSSTDQKTVRLCQRFIEFINYTDVPPSLNTMNDTLNALVKNKDALKTNGLDTKVFDKKIAKMQEFLLIVVRGADEETPTPDLFLKYLATKMYDQRKAMLHALQANEPKNWEKVPDFKKTLSVINKIAKMQEVVRQSFGFLTFLAKKW